MKTDTTTETEQLRAALAEMLNLAVQWERFGGNMTDDPTKKQIENAKRLLGKGEG